jgi:DNA/RNA endonuclease G (NUC1)
MTDFTTIHPLSAAMAHHLDIHLWRGAPQNLDPDRPVQILVNQGYVLGFSPTTLQPAWSAYSVAHAAAAVDFKRPFHYYSDLRLDPAQRLSNRTFGKFGGIPLNVGHMTPNEVINRQYGRLAQAETFLMSNMSPQYETLNQGVWAKLEKAIRAVQTEPGEDYAWVIVGPVFGDDPPHVSRDGGKLVPVPEAYFALVVDPVRYPYDTPASVNLDCFIIPQTAPRGTDPDEYPSTREEIERRTRLRFFDSWGRTYPLGQEHEAAETALAAASSPSRLMRAIAARREEWRAQYATAPAAQPVAKTIGGLIEDLRDEAERHSRQVLEGSRQTTADEMARSATLQHTLSWLMRAQEIVAQSTPGGKRGESAPAPVPADHIQRAPSDSVPGVESPEAGTNIITYKIEEDVGDRLKNGARAACNFWNRFILPRYSIVIRLGVFTSLGNTIARAYQPYEKDGVRYGKVEFNTRFLLDYTPDEIAGTIIHEIGHTLGIGWDDWTSLFDSGTGRFRIDAVNRFAALEHMEVERDGGPGTALSHWDEELFGRELMTGYMDTGEYVLPITIDVMEAFGHDIVERLEQQTSLEELLQGIASLVFTRQDKVRRIDLDYFEKTPLRETVPHGAASDQVETP